MEINFTKNQFQTLLQLLYLGEWVANSYKIKEDKLYKESDSLEQHIYPNVNNPAKPVYVRAIELKHY